jgi:poly-gamma-glutamate capsule biosynthesis protein CapA/YwtB (metallophosphatase superfamily)
MTRTRALALAVVGIVVTLGSAPGAGQAPAADFTLALTGDSIITRRLSVYTEPAFTRLIELVRGADAAFTNIEMLFHDFEPYPMNESGGTYMRAEPALAKELAWAGFDLGSLANNHTGDYGALGMRLTKKYVAEAGIVAAGSGESLPEAREAKFLETAKGRVALISVASTFPDHSRAGRTRGDVPSRPGLSPLRFTTTYVVTPERLEQLRQMAREVTGQPPAAGDSLTFAGRRFVAGTTPGIRTEPRQEDVDEIAAVVKSAATLADQVIVTIHAHEGGKSRLEPAEFLVTFAHAMIDAGADLFVGHGPHVLRGIEVYKGAPILYSLGDFIFQNETLLRYPADNYDDQRLGPAATPDEYLNRRYNFDKSGFPADPPIWESVVAMPRYRNGRLAELALHPISLGFGGARHVRGRPMLAAPELGAKILGDLTKLSAPFGTRITSRDGVGYVELQATASQP